MSTVRVPLATESTYHVFNRSVGKTILFSQPHFAYQVLRLINYYRYEQRIKFSKFKTLTPEFQQQYSHQIKLNLPLVRIAAFSLMPNHYHLLITQLRDKGISTFINNFQNSFAKFFNTIEIRNGSVFQHPFKAKLITAHEEFIHVLRYIHLNPVTSNIIPVEELDNYRLTSHCSYLNTYQHSFIDRNILHQYFSSVVIYKKFISDQAKYQQTLDKIKHLLK